MRAVFCLASGRSGTHFLHQIFRRNAVGCASRHEPYGWNPSMFGRPIYDRAVGDTAAIRRLLARKARAIARCGSPMYLETSHAFLKSWSDLAPEFFPRLKLIHLVRDPLKVAKSEANREALCHWLHLPLRNYRGGDGRPYFRWALTGLEPIYRPFAKDVLTPLQRYAVQWVEIENRAMQFLDRFGLHAECFTLHSPYDLNDAARIAELFEFLGIQHRAPTIALTGRHNRNPRPTVIADADRQQFAAVIRRLPVESLAIFRREPYTHFPWIDHFQSPR